LLHFCQPLLSSSYIEQKSILNSSEIVTKVKLSVSIG
jgi:hypothetical protein